MPSSYILLHVYTALIPCLAAYRVHLFLYTLALSSLHPLTFELKCFYFLVSLVFCRIETVTCHIMCLYLKGLYNSIIQEFCTVQYIYLILNYWRRGEKSGGGGVSDFTYFIVAVYFSTFESVIVSRNTRRPCYVFKRAYSCRVREFWVVTFVKA